MTIANNPCPSGHYCLEGTSTSSTSCGSPDLSSEMLPIMSHAERPTTLRANRIAQGQALFLGARNTGCWTNQTDDFGLQASTQPAHFWMERHLLPLYLDAPFTAIRGRYCLDDKCLAFNDADDYKVSDYAFDYSASSFRLRRPIPCPEGMFIVVFYITIFNLYSLGMYCHPGTAVDAYNARNFTTPQPCFESVHCPEGSETPNSNDCEPGFYCPFGVKIACPVSTYCPR